MHHRLLNHGRVIWAAMLLPVLLLAHVPVRGQEGHRSDAPPEIAQAAAVSPRLPRGKRK